MASQAPPSVPPRPSRSPKPQSQGTPAVPPRPAARTAQSSDNANGLPSPSPSPEPEPKTIGSSTELHAPVAISSRPTAPPKADSERLRSVSVTPSITKPPQEEKEGIPQIGRRVPMYPNAGDVQAPTPSATPSSSRKKHVYREEWEMDDGAYGSGRRETPYSMSSTDLNAVVAQSATPGVGVDESKPGVPDEELAYLASDSYTQALSRSVSRSQSPVHTKDSAQASSVDVGAAARDEHGNVIHVEDPVGGPGYLRRGNSDHATSRAQSHHGDEEDEEEQEHYSILAEDEVLKRQSGQYMQAAVYTPSYTPRHPRSRPPSSMREHRDDSDSASLELTTKFDSKSGLESRDSVRTPYEELSPADENAKPLFPEDDKEGEALKNPLIEKLKRPGLIEHRFPSNDVWEEAPEHAQLEATVESPPPGQVQKSAEDFDHQEEAPRRSSAEPEPRFVRGQPHEHYEPGDEQEFEQKQKEAAMKDTDYRLDLQDLPEDERLRRLHKTVGSDDDTPESSIRRGVHRRKFPSNDLWEEVPPSQDLQEEIEPAPIPDKERATTGDISAIPEPSTRPTTGAPIEGSSSLQKPAIPPRPAVPARPSREKKFPPATIPEQPEPAPEASDKKVPPAVPDKPKPSVPARAVGKLAGFVKTQTEETPEPKPKPPVPPRTGGKIAAMKAGFLGDLESRLRLGPSATPKKEEKKEEEEPVKEEPLTDVRKNRARGPRGRKLPTKEEKEKPAVDVPKNIPNQIVGVWTVFKLDEDLDSVLVNNASEQSAPPASEEDTPAGRTDQDTASSEPKEEAKEEVKETGAPVVTTTTLPGVTGTGQQAASATQVKPEQPKEESKPTAAEEGNPTAIPAGEHPEDAVQPLADEVKTPQPSSEATGNKELQEPETAKETVAESENKEV